MGKTTATLLITVLMGSGFLAVTRAQQTEAEFGVDHSECALFGPEGEQFRSIKRDEYQKSEITSRVSMLLGSSNAASHAASKAARSAGGLAVIPAGPRTDLFEQLDRLSTIDRHLFRAMRTAGVTPAATSNDYEFARRVSLDLTGRIPTVERLRTFAASNSEAKRAGLIDELLASPEWADKWAMFLGDLYDNNDNNPQVRRYPEGRNAFHRYLRDSLTANKKYDVMVREMISATGTNSYEQGELNWHVGGFMSGGPVQDTYDQQAVFVADKFLGISYQTCIMCHDGRRHLDTLSVWGKTETRVEGWGMSSFFSKSAMTRVPVEGAVNGQPYYYRVDDRPALANYALNTTTGNRPARQPIGTLRNVPPQYPFADGGAPRANETYRQALARLVTADPQFARATVNYVWKQFFGRGIVEPVNQFDPARLQPGPDIPEGWSVQPANPDLLEALAADFAKNQFDLRWLMRSIANSEAYQLSSRYEGEWKPEYEKLHARKFVRRLWGEEIADAVVQASGMPVQYTVNGAGFGPVDWAMQLPQTRGLGNAAVPAAFRLPGIQNTYTNTTFLDSFLRGNRVEEERRADGSVAQALNLMNDRFVLDRTRAVGAGATASLARRLLNQYPAANDNLLVNEMFLTVLSRPANEDELRAATSALAQGSSAALRQQKVEDLLWALYNKVDFVFNY